MNKLLYLLISFGIPTAIAIVGVNTLFQSADCLLTYHASKNWPATTGVIVDSSVHDGYGKYNNRYRVHISYQYTIDNVEFESDRIYTGYPSSSEADAIEMSNEYPAGSSKPVFYDPKNPKKSVLQKRLGDTIALLLLVSLVFTLGGMWGLRLSYLAWKRKKCEIT